MLDAEGIPQLIRIENVIVVGQPGGGGGNGGGGGDELSPTAVQVRAWADEVDDPAGRAVLLLVYETIRKSVANDELPPAETWNAVRKATDEAFERIPDAPKWTGFRQSVTDLIVAKLQRGELGTKEQAVEFLRDVVHGLGADQSLAALKPETVRAIVDAILAIIRELVNRPELLPAPPQ